MRKYALISLLPILALLAGCNLKPLDIGRSDMFALHYGQISPPIKEPLPQSLIVALPTAPDALDTYRVALLRNHGTWDYYAGTRWADFLAGMVQDSLVKSIEGAKVFKTTTSDAAGLTGGLMLRPMIRAFNAVYPKTGAAPVIRVRIVATLTTGFSRQIIATISGVAEKRASSDSLSAIQSAFQQAYLSVERQLVLKLATVVTTPSADLAKTAVPIKLEK